MLSSVYASRLPVCNPIDGECHGLTILGKMERSRGQLCECCSRLNLCEPISRSKVKPEQSDETTGLNAILLFDRETGKSCAPRYTWSILGSAQYSLFFTLATRKYMYWWDYEQLLLLLLLPGVCKSSSILLRREPPKGKMKTPRLALLFSCKNK